MSKMRVFLVKQGKMKDEVHLQKNMQCQRSFVLCRDHRAGEGEGVPALPPGHREPQPRLGGRGAQRPDAHLLGGDPGLQAQLQHHSRRHQKDEQRQVSAMEGGRFLGLSRNNLVGF